MPPTIDAPVLFFLCVEVSLSSDESDDEELDDDVGGGRCGS